MFMCYIFRYHQLFARYSMTHFENCQSYETRQNSPMILYFVTFPLFSEENLLFWNRNFIRRFFNEYNAKFIALWKFFLKKTNGECFLSWSSTCLFLVLGLVNWDTLYLMSWIFPSEYCIRLGNHFVNIFREVFMSNRWIFISELIVFLNFVQMMPHVEACDRSDVKRGNIFIMHCFTNKTGF